MSATNQQLIGTVMVPVTVTLPQDVSQVDSQTGGAAAGENIYMLVGN